MINVDEVIVGLVFAEPMNDETAVKLKRPSVNSRLALILIWGLGRFLFSNRLELE